MRRVTYTDRRGHLKVALVRDTDPDEVASSGLPLGPPNIDGIDWEEVKKEINNAMVRDGVLGIKDLPRHPNSLTAAVRSALVGRIVVLLKQQEAPHE